MQEDAPREATNPQAKPIYKPIPEIASWETERVSVASLFPTYSAFLTVRDQANSQVVDKLVKILERQAAAESVAVEGFYNLKPGDSLSIAREDPAWEGILQSQDAINVGLFESQLNAFEYAREAIAANLPVTQQLLKEIHAIACKDQEFYEVAVSLNGTLSRERRRLQHGQYKTEENFTRLRSGAIHIYAPVQEVGPEIQRLVDQLQLNPGNYFDPLTKAAYVHYCITHIHPFSDGNGRVARALASAYTSKEFGVPLLVYGDRRLAYQQAIELTANGDVPKFIGYVEVRVIDALQFARLQLRGLSSPDIDDRFGKLLSEVQRYKDVELKKAEVVAAELIEEMRIRARTKLEYILEGRAELLQEEVRADQPYDMPYSAQSGSYSMTHGFSIGLRLTKPEDISPCIVYISAGYSTDKSAEFAFHVGVSRSKYFNTETPDVEGFFIVTEDVQGQLSANLLDRLDSLMDATIAYMVNHLETEFMNFLKQTGNLGIA
jgi:Fic family protein